MENKALYDKRYDNLMKTLNRQKADYVPNLAYPGPGTCTWAGTTALESLENKDKYVHAMNDVFAKMWLDCSTDHGLVFNPELDKIFRGVLEFKLGPDGTTMEHVHKPQMLDDDYDALNSDFNGFISDVIVKRKYPWLFNGDIETAKNEIKEYFRIMDMMADYNAAVYDSMVNDYSIVMMLTYDYGYPMTSIDYYFDTLRGFKNTLTDIRRRPEKVKEAIKTIWRENTGFIVQSEIKEPFPYMSQWHHIPAYLSAKLFEELYWPEEKMIIEHAAEAGSKIMMLLEGKWAHLFDYFKDVPKDSCLLMTDDDDVIDLKKALGDYHIIEGGAKLAKIRLEDKQANIDYTKKVLDECAPGGAFIFGTDKNWIAPGDVNQNLIDVFNFAHEYGKY